MTRGKMILICGIFLIAIVMLFVIFAPSSFKFKKNQPAPSPNNWQTNPSIIPQSMQGRVTASLSAELKPINNSNITGVTIFKEINGKVFVGVVLENPETDSEYPAYIHFGRCSDSEGPKYSLSPVVNGRTENYITKTMTDFKKELPLSVKIHKPPDESEGYISCADLK